MTTMSERARLTYTGEQTIELPGSAYAVPSIVSAGDEVELEGWAATALLNTSGTEWQLVGGDAPAGLLRGEELTAALVAAGLPTTGKVAEKRARLAEHEAAQPTVQQDPEVAPPADAATIDDDDPEGADTHE